MERLGETERRVLDKIDVERARVQGWQLEDGAGSIGGCMRVRACRESKVRLSLWGFDIDAGKQCRDCCVLRDRNKQRWGCAAKLRCRGRAKSAALLEVRQRWET